MLRILWILSFAVMELGNDYIVTLERHYGGDLNTSLVSPS